MFNEWLISLVAHPSRVECLHDPVIIYLPKTSQQCRRVLYIECLEHCPFIFLICLMKYTYKYELTGSAVGFKLDSLLKLADTRASNNKMTLMHYLCKVLLLIIPLLKFVCPFLVGYLYLFPSWLIRGVTNVLCFHILHNMQIYFVRETCLCLYKY